MNLNGKTALVTGASSGIGEAFAYLLAQKGMNLVLVARTESKLESIAEAIQQNNGVAVHVYAQDLSVTDSGKTLYDKVKADQVEVDLLINNAGFGKWGKFEAFSLKEYQQMVQLNVTSLMDLCHLFIEDFKQRPEAGIINVGSTASFVPIPYSAVYAATKAFVLSFTEGLVGEFADTNISITCLCPGATSSNFANIASSGSDATDSSVEYKSSAEVAQIGLDTFLAKKHYVMTGRTLQLKVMKFFSRKRVISMVADYWKKRLGIS